MGKEYLVEGAKLKCIHGSEVTQLRVPGHGYTSGGKQKANILDCKKGINIQPFGQCQKEEKEVPCSGCMRLRNKWESTSTSPTKPEMVNGHPALTMDSVLLCNHGGIIMPITSGQGYERGVDWASFRKRFLKMIRWAAGKNLLCHVFGGDPINMNTGNFIYEKEDLKIGGITNLSFRLFYNTMEEGRGGCLGQGWHHNQETRICRKEKGMLLLCLEDGREIPYRRGIGKLYSPLFGDSGLLWQEKEGYRYGTVSGEEFIFNEEGLLQRKVDSRGNTDTYFYDEKGQLIQVKGANGGELFYRYNEEGNLIRVKDHTGREVQLWYSYGKLRKYVNACGHAYTYSYNVNGRLESVLTPRGIVGVKNTYDGANRVVKQEMPDGGILTMEYDDENNRTYVTEPGGRRIIYESDERFRNIRTIYEDGEEQYAYNERNQRTLYVDKLGNKTRYRYDEKGNLTKIIDALNNQILIKYNEKNEPIEYRFPRGGCISNIYDASGNLIKRTNQMGDSVELSYNSKGQPLMITYPDSSFVSITYDTRGNISQVGGNHNRCMSYQYDELNRVISATDAKGQTTQFAYDERDNLIKIINTLGKERNFTYNESGLMNQIIDFDGTVQRFFYDECNRLKCYENQEGSRFEYKYDKANNLTEISLPNGGKKRFSYDYSGNLIEVEDEVGAKTKYQYDPCGNCLGVTNPLGEKNYYVYDELGRVIKETNFQGHKTIFEYDSEGNVVSVNKEEGSRKIIEYDLENKKIAERNELNQKTKFIYNSMGLLSDTIDSVGRKVSYKYYPGGRLEKIVYPDGRSISHVYDANGNVKEKWDSHGYHLYQEYDELNRILSIRSSDNQKVHYGYDDVGNITYKKDAMGNETFYQYSPIGKLKQLKDEGGNITQYFYDVMGNLTGVFQTGEKEERKYLFEELLVYKEKFHGLHFIQYEYDLSQRMIAEINALGHKKTYEYDRMGNLIQKIDEEGYKTSFSYNPGGILSAIQYNDGRKIEYSYNTLGKISEVTDWNGKTIIDYDENGRIKKVKDHQGKVIGYQWGEFGERKAVIYPDRERVHYYYDDLLRLKEINCGLYNVSYCYGKEGRLKRKSCNNGIIADYAYDQAGRLTGLTYQRQGKIIESYKYMYDKVNRKTSIKKYRYGLPEESGEYGYEYDVFGNLTAVRKDGDILREYTYDHFHNRISLKNKSEISSYLYNAANQLVYKNDGSERFYRYDQRGNLVEITEEGGWINQYTYDCSGRMSEAKNIHRGEASYVYDGLGKRIRVEKRAVGKEPVAVHYCWDITKRYQNLLSAQQGKRKQNYYWGHFLEGIKEDRTQSILLDELGSPLRIVGITGKEQVVYSYDEFGTAMCENTDFNQPFGYTGYLADEIGGTYFANAREYVADIGRFAGQDLLPGSIYSSVSLNRYIYCRNDSVNYIDLDGNIAILAAAGIVALGAALGGAMEAGFQAYDIYKSGGDVTDIGNYNGIQIGISTLEGGIMALIPIGVGANVIKPFAGGLLQVGTGIGAEVMRETERNTAPGWLDYVESIFTGGVNSMVSIKLGNLWGKHPYLHSLTRSIEYTQSAIKPMVGGKYVTEVPIGYLKKVLIEKIFRQFGIEQTIGIPQTIIINQVLQNIEEILEVLIQNHKGNIMDILHIFEKNPIDNKE